MRVPDRALDSPRSTSTTCILQCFPSLSNNYNPCNSTPSGPKHQGHLLIAFFLIYLISVYYQFCHFTFEIDPEYDHFSPIAHPPSRLPEDFSPVTLLPLLSPLPSLSPHRSKSDPCTQWVRLCHSSDPTLQRPPFSLQVGAKCLLPFSPLLAPATLFCLLFLEPTAHALSSSLSTCCFCCLNLSSSRYGSGNSHTSFRTLLRYLHIREVSPNQVLRP